MAKLTIMCSLPRAGKSTYAQLFLKGHVNASDGELEHRIVINADEFRLALHGQRFSSKAEPMIHAIIDVVLDVFMKGSYHILIDECNTSESLIKKWLKLDANARFIYINTHPAVCKERAIACQQNDLVDCGVIDRMEENLQKMVFGEITGEHPNQEKFKKAIERIRSENVS